MDRRNWTEKETCIALVLYYEIPFAKINKNHPLIINVAQKLGRTPSALSMKMCNLARFDPTLQKENISGLTHGSRMDEYVWTNYANNFIALSEILGEIKDYFPNSTPSTISEVHEGHVKKALLNYRQGQNFFRDAVLSAYNYTCCITGITIHDLLITSHIKPWSQSDDKTEKANPRNGLCLNALHDKAFDKGLITLDKHYSIIVSDKLKKDRHLDERTKDWICAFEGRQIQLPHRSLPDLQFIEYHNDMIFKK